MKKLMGFVLGVCFVLTCAQLAATQEQNSGSHKPPKILSITREYLKPYKNGTPHEKTESVYLQAATRFKSPTHYIGMESVSGKPRALFFVGYESFEQWQKQASEQHKNEALSAAIDHANLADAELLDSTDITTWYFDEDSSFNPGVDIPQMRYFEIERFKIRQGHEAEWAEGVKLVKAAYAKALPDAHWAMYGAIYGIATPTYLVITPLKSAADIDRNFAANPKFVEAMGADGMKKLSELSAASIEASETNLFEINPKMSYVDEHYAKANPEFWGAKSAAAPPTKKSAPEKPKSN
jgi:hypothetical protein